MANHVEKQMDEQILDDTLKTEVNTFEFSPMYGENSDDIVTESVSFWKGATRRLLSQKLTLFSLFLIILIVLLAIFIPFGRENLAFVQDPNIQNLPPKMPLLENIGIFDGMRNNIDMYAKVNVDRYYFFGTDLLGRDIFLRVWIGIRTSLLLALIVTTIEMVVGGIVGGVSGYVGGRVDMIIQRILEIFVNIPTLIVVMVVTLALGPSFTTLVIALSLFGWIAFSRLVRAQILQYKEQEFVLAAKTLGASPMRIMMGHLMPNILSTFVVSLTLSFPAVILTEAYYTILALGLPPEDISLGQLMVENIGKLSTFPSQLIIPTVFMAIISLSFNLFGNGLRDALDPKMKQQ